MALLDTIKGFGKKVGSLFDRVGPTYVSPSSVPKVSGTTPRVASAGAVAAPTMPKVGPNYVGAQAPAPAPTTAPVPTPKAPAQATVAAAIAPTMNRLAAEAGNSSSGSAPMNFTAPIDTPTKTTDLQPRGRSDAQRLRDDLEKRFAPSKAEVAARDRLAAAESALANIRAGSQAQRDDIYAYNPDGVFGGGVATREGQIGREEFLRSAMAQGQLAGAESEYNRLSQARQTELSNYQTIQGLTAPEVLGTPSVNKSTGDVTAYIQNPDGTVSTQVIGNVGLDASFDLQSVIRNEATGQAFAVGLQNGKVVTQPLDGTAGLAPRVGSGIYGNLSLTAGQETEIADTNTLISMIGSAEASFAQGGGSGVGGLGTGSIKQFFAKNFGTGSPQEIQLRNQIGNIAGTIAKLRGGTSFTDSEKALLETYSPTINDSAIVAEQKLIDLRSFLETKRASLLGVAGGNYSGDLPMTDSDPLGLGI